MCGPKSLVYLMETTISVDSYQDIDLKSTVETSSPEVPTMLGVRWTISRDLSLSKTGLGNIQISQIPFVLLMSKLGVPVASPIERNLESTNFDPHETLVSVDK